MNKQFSVKILFVLVCTLTILSRSATAADDIKKTMGKVADVILPILKNKGISSISIGEFTGPPSFASAAGTGIRVALAQELSKRGIREKKLGTSIGVKGEYRPLKKQDGSVVLRVNVTLVDATGESLSDLSVKVNFRNQSSVKVTKGAFGVDNKSPDTLARALGANIDLIKKGEFGDFVSKTKGSEILDSFNRPKAIVYRNGGVASSRRSPFIVEILVNGQPRRATLVDGHPFINLVKEETFQIRVRNNADYDLGVKFYLDGVNSFTFSDIKSSGGNPKYSLWVVKKRSSFTLKGWHKNNQTVEKFKVTDFEQSAASRVGSSQQLGTISVSFQAAWVPATDPTPVGEPQVHFSKGIGFGEKDIQKAIEENKKRKYGILRSMVTIRYEKES